MWGKNVKTHARTHPLNVSSDRSRVLTGFSCTVDDVRGRLIGFEMSELLRSMLLIDDIEYIMS